MFYFLRTLIVLAFLYPSLPSFASEQNFYENDSSEETDTEQNKVSDDIVNSCAPQCKELKVGECRKPVSCSRLESPAKKSSAFKVCKTGKNKLTAHLNITFYKDSGKGANSIRNAARRFPSKANDTDRKWRKKTQACINRFRNRLNDGKRSLDIKLHSISSKKGSSNILIEVESDRQRSLDVSWRKDIDCETILHEVGHHLGLCDEYKVHKNDRLLVGAPGETIIKKNVFSSSHSNKNYQPRRSCRALGHKNSLMRNPTRALHGPKNIRYIMCKCNGARKDDLSRCRYNHPSIEQIYLSNDPDDLKKAVQAQAIRKKNRGCPRGFSPTTRSPKVFGKNKSKKKFIIFVNGYGIYSLMQTGI